MEVSQRFRSRHAVVTGGAAGIGRAISERLAAEGANVWVLDRDSAAAAEVCATIRAAGGCADPLVADVSDLVAMRAALARPPRIDVLVNNAGVGHIGTVVTTEPDDFDRLFAINVKGVYHGLHLTVPRMLQQGGGVILNLCSIAGKTGLEERFAYSMSKGAVHAMTLQTARDLVTHGIRCNGLCPARVHTGFVDTYLARNYPGREAEMLSRLSAAQPMGRMGTPAEIAALAAFLCSDEAAFITGALYDIDGGVMGMR